MIEMNGNSTSFFNLGTRITQEKFEKLPSMPNFLSGTFFLFSHQVPVGLTRNFVATVDERVQCR